MRAMQYSTAASIESKSRALANMHTSRAALSPLNWRELVCGTVSHLRCFGCGWRCRCCLCVVLSWSVLLLLPPLDDDDDDNEDDDAVDDDEDVDAVASSGVFIVFLGSGSIRIDLSALNALPLPRPMMMMESGAL